MQRHPDLHRGVDHRFGARRAVLDALLHCVHEQHEGTGAVEVGDRGATHRPVVAGRRDPTEQQPAPAVVMLAQGVGVAPFRSMLTHAALAGVGVPTTLVHVGTGHAYRDDTSAAAVEAFCPTSHEEFADHVAAVTARQPHATSMVAGTRAFVAGTAAQLTGPGVDPPRIRRDAFYGWSGGRSPTALTVRTRPSPPPGGRATSPAGRERGAGSE